MIQSFRDNMKGTLVVIIIIIFVVPMVLSGIGTDFLGSAAGTTVAKVNGKKIYRHELNRMISQEKNRLLSQEGVDPNADYLKDENLRGPVLQRLVRETAIIEALKKDGMGISSNKVDEEILSIEQFKIDGQFDKQVYRRVLQSVGYTPATFKVAVGDDLIGGQFRESIGQSGFITDTELDALVAITQQKRTFYAVTIPRSSVSQETSISEEQIAEYYTENSSRYVEPEKVSINYVELSLDNIIESIEITEEDIIAEYDREVSQFASDTEYEIAHILVEGDDVQSTIDEITDKLDSEDFANLVEQYSDDKSTKRYAGNLGLHTKDMFSSSEFDEAVYALETGQVSNPVKTEAGTHFIKLLDKTVPTPPTLEERKEDIRATLATVEAEVQFDDLFNELEDLIYASDDDIQQLATSAGLTVETSNAFSRTVGDGIASNAAIRNAAFSESVIVDGYMSEVLEIEAGQRVIVLAKKEHFPVYTKPLEEVRDSIVTILEREAIDASLAEKADQFIEKLKIEEDKEGLAKTMGYAFEAHEGVTSFTADVNPQLLRKVFEMDVVDEVFYSSDKVFTGDYQIVALQDVEVGNDGDLDQNRKNLIRTQMAIQLSNIERSVFENEVVANSKISLH